MQNSENVFQTPERPANMRQTNTDPREQIHTQENAYRSYEEGYGGLDTRDIWNEGEKLRPEMKSEKSIGGMLLVIALVCVAFVAGGLFGGNLLGDALHWLTWVILAGVIAIGAVLIATNWRVTTI